MGPLVSVIIPVYNVQKYLSKCLDSVVNQTYKNIEIIIIDDGSTDDSFYICEDYQKKDYRITLIHQENKGLASARNVGIQSAKGDYFVFIDSDDFVSEYYVELLLKTIIITNSLLASTRSYIPFWDGKEEGIIFENTDNYNEKIKSYDKFDFIKLMMEEQICTGAPFKIYNRCIFDTFLFPEGYYEDLALLYKLCASQERIALLDMKIYAYRKRSGSIIRNSNIEKKSIILSITDEMMDFFKDYPSDVINSVKARAFITIFSVFTQIPVSNNPLMKKLWDKLIEYRKIDIRNINNRKLKNEIILSYFGMRISHFIGRLGRTIANKGLLWR